MPEDNNNEETHYQVVFFSRDKRLADLLESVLSVPSSSSTNEFNALVNGIAESVDEQWQPLKFDFLINNAFVRSAIGEIDGLSSEIVVRVECILREPSPQPNLNLKISDWVSDVKVGNNSIFSVNYGGDLDMWSLSGKKITSAKSDTEALKCVDLCVIDGEEHVVVGSQNQTLVLYKIDASTSGRKAGGESAELTPVAVFRGHNRSVECVASSADGLRFVSSGFDNCLKVWGTERENDNAEALVDGNAKRAKTTLQSKTPMVTLESHREAVVDVAWSPLNGAQVVTASWDHSLALWDLELAGTLSTMNSNKAFLALSLNPSNALIVTGSTDTAIRMWDFRSKEGSLVKSTFLGHHGWVTDLCWSPDADHLFVSSSFDKTVRMWDIRSPKASLYDMMGHEDRVLAVDWSTGIADGSGDDQATTAIASGSADCTLRTFRHSRNC